MTEVTTWLVNNLDLSPELATDLLITAMGVFAGSFLALCLFGIIYGLIASTR